jgi:hypothetical protein
LKSKISNRFEIKSILNQTFIWIEKCPAIFRTSSDRSGFENDSNSNFAARFYFMLTNNNIDEESFMKYCLFICSVCMDKILATCGEQNTVPQRAQIFFNKEDGFFSIVLGYKLTVSKSKIKAGELRLYFPMVLNSEDSSIKIITVNTYETHKAIGTTDIKHVDEAPIVDKETKNVIPFLKECEEISNKYFSKKGGN